MNKEKTITIIGAVVSILGIGASLAADWVNDQKMNIKIQQEVQKALLKNK